MTLREATEKRYQTFLKAWDEYSKINDVQTKSTGFNELLSSPALKAAYQKWQLAVNDYYDFAKSIENRDLNEEFREK